MAESVSPAAVCVRCQAAPKQSHRNAKYCLACRAEYVRRPRSTLTPEQGALVARWTGTLSRTEIAQRLGVSRANVLRYIREHGVYGRSDAYPPAVVEAVLRVYEQAPPGQGKREVERLFPGVRVDCITERHRDFAPRQIRWTGAQQIEAARMAGLVSAAAQAQFFGRPNAHEGSIKSLWAKRFQCAPMDVNGLSGHLAFRIARAGVPATMVKYRESAGAAYKVLWLDLQAWLRPDVPEWVRAAVDALARFQAWLHGTTTPADIRQMIQEREVYDGQDPEHTPGERHRRGTTSRA